MACTTGIVVQAEANCKICCRDCRSDFLARAAIRRWAGGTNDFYQAAEKKNGPHAEERCAGATGLRRACGSVSQLALPVVPDSRCTAPVPELRTDPDHSANFCGLVFPQGCQREACCRRAKQGAGKAWNQFYEATAPYHLFSTCKPGAARFEKRGALPFNPAFKLDEMELDWLHSIQVGAARKGCRWPG